MIILKEITYEVKSLDDALTEAVETFRVNKRYIKTDIEEKKALLGLKKSYIVNARVEVDYAQLGLETLETLFENMGVKATIKVSTPSDNEITYEVETDENPLLIGKNGKTLESIQYYIRNIVSIFSDERTIVLVDIGGYKANRKRQLEILATKTAKNVARSRIEAKLEPMNAYERRIIHTKLSDWRDVTTISEGEGRDRHLVIKPTRK